MISVAAATTALILGGAGSLHCMGMCGPLMIALPAATGRQRLPWHLPVLYHAGRIFTYAMIGMIAGMAGQSVVFVAGQQTLSLTVGIIILLALFLPKKWRQSIAMIGPIRKGWTKLHALWAKAAKQGGLGWVLMGTLNGLLPCGLVYAAAAGAAATGAAISGAIFMALFGLANAPILIALSTASARIPKLQSVSQRIVPIAALTVAALLILRGLALDIPYLSPDLTPKAGTTTPSCCH